MAERLKELGKRILDWWKKFDIKKKIALISAVAVVILTVAILALVLTRTTMVYLMTCESTAEASDVKKILDDAGIDNQVSDDGLRISVAEDDKAAASLELGANGYPTAEFDLDKVFSGGFSSTESDKEKKYNAYLESKIASYLSSMEVVDEAKIALFKPDDNGTILASEQEASVSVSLKLNDDIDDDVAAGIARFVATSVGNKSTSNITIMDYSANLLFSGDEPDGTGISASTMASQLNKSTEQMKKAVKEVFLSQGYDSVTVAPQLKLDTARTSQTSTEYSAPEGRDEGMLDSEEWFRSESVNQAAGVPGTDSNDDTTYMIETNGESSSQTDEGSRNYLPNKTETTTERSAGGVLYDESTIAVVLTNYVYYNEDELEAQGLLEDITFDEFVAQNRDRVMVDVDDELYQSVSMATGITNRDNISILSYEQPFFQPSDGGGIPWSMILTILVLVLIVLLLAFIVFRSTRPVVVEEIEPEASVEDLIASTTTETLEDIEYEDRSEARKMIDKFVDENPEAVAQLLRNWLNDDWGE